MILILFPHTFFLKMQSSGMNLWTNFLRIKVCNSYELFVRKIGYVMNGLYCKHFAYSPGQYDDGDCCLNMFTVTRKQILLQLLPSGPKKLLLSECDYFEANNRDFCMNTQKELGPPCRNMSIKSMVFY